MRRVGVLAGPIVVSQLGQTGMVAVDAMMVGHLGATALAAAGLGNALHTGTLVLFMGTLMGVGPLVSRAAGARDAAAGERLLVHGLWLAALLSVPLGAVTFLGEPLALALDQDPEVSRITGGYMAALAWGVPAVLAFTAVRQFLEGRGVTRPAMVVTFLGFAANIAGNQLLIHGWGEHVPALGVVGSGWSTTAVRWIMLLALGVYVVTRDSPGLVRRIGWRPEGRGIARVAALGAPIGGQLAVEVGVFAFAAVMVGWLGPRPLAAHEVAINLASLTFMVALGVSLAGSIRVGQEIGAGHRGRAWRAAGATYAVTTLAMAFFALVFLLAPGPLVGVYTDDPEVVRVAIGLLGVAALFQLFDGAQVAGLSILRGASDTRIPFLLAALGYWGVGFPTAYLLGFTAGHGPIGVWWGLCAGLATVAVLLLFRVRRVLEPVAASTRTAEGEPSLQ